VPSRPAPSPCARPFAARLRDAALRGSRTSTRRLVLLVERRHLVLGHPHAGPRSLDQPPDVSYSVYARSAVRCRGSSSSRLSAAWRSSGVISSPAGCASPSAARATSVPDRSASRTHSERAPGRPATTCASYGLSSVCRARRGSPQITRRTATQNAAEWAAARLHTKGRLTVQETCKNVS
jgi:hypothetical protein